MNISFINPKNQNADLEKVSELMDTLPNNKISFQPWPEYQNNCEANFSIGHSGDAILLKYYVKEDVIKVAKHKTNDKVHKDNCVEFFISFSPKKEYYNIELNCLGICLVAYGKERENRKVLSENLINRIRKNISIKSASENSSTNFEWEITLVIPIEVFEFENFESFIGQNAHGNFFKCGDDLPEPHFFAWNMIHAKTPNFHLPEFFGALAFG